MSDNEYLPSDPENHTTSTDMRSIRLRRHHELVKAALSGFMSHADVPQRYCGREEARSAASFIMDVTDELMSRMAIRYE